MTEQENPAIIGNTSNENEFINDIGNSNSDVEESEQGNGIHNREIKRRRRLSPEETRILSEIYEHTQKPNSVLRNRLAQELGMSSRQIQIWFQNRRAKIKRDVNDPNGNDSTKQLYFSSDSSHPYYVPYPPPGTISNSLQTNSSRPLGMLNIASKPILPINSLYPQKQYPMGIQQQMNSYQLPVSTMGYQNNQSTSAISSMNYGYSIRPQLDQRLPNIQSSKSVPIQNPYIQSSNQRNIQRIIPGNSMIPLQQQQQQQQQQIRPTNQVQVSTIQSSPIYSQPTTQVPIYSTTNQNLQSYPATTNPVSNIPAMSYQQKIQMNNGNQMYMNYQTGQNQQPVALSQQQNNNIYLSNVGNNMMYNQNGIPTTTMVNSTSMLTSSTIARPTNPIINYQNKQNTTQNPNMSPNQNIELNKNVNTPQKLDQSYINNVVENRNIATTIPTTNTSYTAQTIQTIQTNKINNNQDLTKMTTTGIVTSPIKAMINSSINSKVAAKAAAAAAAAASVKQETTNNQNIAPTSLFNTENEKKTNSNSNQQDSTNVKNINVMDSMLFSPKSKLPTPESAVSLSEDVLNLDQAKDSNQKQLNKDGGILYDANETMKWIDGDSNWNQPNQVSQFPSPSEDKRNQKENAYKDINTNYDILTKNSNSLSGLNDDSLNEPNSQLWLSDDIDYLLHSENFQM